MWISGKNEGGEKRRKINDISLSTICNHIREIEENLEDDDKNLIEAQFGAAVAYCKGYTGLTEEELNEHEDITIAVLALIADMWDNRSTTVSQANPNRTVETILGMYSTNLLPNGE